MRRHRPFLAAALLATLSACADDTPTAPAPGDAGPRDPGPRGTMNATTARVVGYFPTWQGSVSAIPYNKLTHILYAFALPTTSGGLTGIAMSGDTRLASLVTQAHANGVKVLISVGGWNDTNDATFAQMAASSTARASFVSNVGTFVSNYGLDGVDIDWEYPDAGSAESTNFTTLMGQLSTAMHGSGKLLTAAVAADRYWGDGIQSTVFGYVDFLTIMAYSRDTPPHSPYWYAVASLDYWAGRGLAQSRTVLGVPFYGKNSSGVDSPYRSIVQADAQAPNKDYSNGYYYNGMSTIQQKTTLSLQRGSGVGIWELSNDTTASTISLLSAIQTAMNSTVPAYDYTRTVYDDSLGGGWDDWSWNTTLNFASTAQAHAGSKSIAVTYTAAWGALYLHYDFGLPPSGRSKLEFWVHGGSTGGQRIIAQVGEPGSSTVWLNEVPVNSYNSCGTVTANTWCKVSIPFSALGVTSNPITELVIQDDSGGAQPTFYVDDIRFVP